MKNIVLCAVILAVFLGGANAFAVGNNVADLTNSYVYCPATYVKGIYDEGPRSILGGAPIGHKTSLLLWRWDDEPGKDRAFTEVALAHRVNEHLDLGFVRDAWVGDNTELSANAVVDLRSKYVSLGMLIPTNGNGTIQYGPRVQLAPNLVGYATASEGTNPLFGLGKYGKKLNLDVTVGTDRWYFRASTPIPCKYGTFRPELRLRKVGDETFVGFGLLFIAK